MRTRLFLSTFALSSLLLAAAGCDGDTETDGEGGGGGPPALDCAVTAAEGAAIELGEGAHTRIALAFGADVSSVTIASTSPGLRAALSEAGDEIILEADYGTGGETVSVTFDASCGEGTEPADLEATVRAINFEPLADWTSPTEGPLGREYGTMWIDAADPDRLLVFGGFLYEPEQFTPSSDLWEFDLAGGGWTELTPSTPAPATPGGRMIEIGGERSAYYYGGLEITPEGGGSTPYSLVRFDYAPDALAFSDVAVTTEKSSGDYQPAMVFDAPRNRYVTACGVNDAQGYHCRVHTFDPASGEWTHVLAEADDGERPKGRNGLFYVHDVPNERLVLFSGDMGSGGWACDCAEDTWALELAEDPPRWVKLAEPQDPPIGRRNGAFAYDPVGHRMFIWGGTPDGMETFPGLYAFDLDRGEEGWSKVETSFTPPERSSGMAVFDAARNRLVMGFGNGGAVYTDLWALTL